MIPYDLKKRCVELKRSGMTAREIYNGTFVLEHQGMCLETFKRKLQYWAKDAMCDEQTIECGTYPSMIAHGATVQVNSSGGVVQAWIKQHADDAEWQKIAELLTHNIEPLCVDCIDDVYTAEDMLEIPLLDMHFGIAKLDDYKDICKEIYCIVRSKRWNEINIIIGQDMLHNNDMRGHTAKGTAIEKVDFVQAWEDAWSFWNIIITACLESADNVCVRYSKGNHDECSSWCFVECLKARFPQVHIDDAIKPRKAIVWHGCFIGYGHCEYGRSADKLFRDFVMDYPKEFSAASVREIHTGHLHGESTDNGLIVRRLSSAVPIDEWSSNHGFVGAHKRFQLFEYGENRLKSIHYV